MESVVEECARRISVVVFFNYEPAKEKAKKAQKADNKENCEDDSSATFTRNSTAFKEGNEEIRLPTRP